MQFADGFQSLVCLPHPSGQPSVPGKGKFLLTLSIVSEIDGPEKNTFHTPTPNNAKITATTIIFLNIFSSPILFLKSMRPTLKKCKNMNFFSKYGYINKEKGGFYMNIVQKTALVLTVIGALNWGMIGLFNFDLVATIFGSMTIVTRTIYTLVGIAGLINIMLFFVDLDEMVVIDNREKAR